MKRALLCFIFVCLTALCLDLLPRAGAQTGAQTSRGGRLTLLCTGWLPAYRAWEAPQAADGAQGALLRVEIDRDARTVSTSLDPTGEVVAALEISDRFYSGTAALGRLLFNRNLDGVEFSINRITGAGRLRYMVGETSYPAFEGNCAPARARS